MAFSETFDLTFCIPDKSKKAKVVHFFYNVNQQTLAACQYYVYYFCELIGQSSSNGSLRDDLSAVAL